MTSTFKIGTHGFYCSECRMVFGEPHETCPFCGSIVSNYEEILTDSIVKQFVNDITSSPPPDEIRGWRRHMNILDDSPMLDKETLKTFMENLKNESNIY